ncbi:hypothetical protein KIH31_02870 [Paenarthrobacter sp. DKR-5]|uniref:hypothetical protein n=1 Tax=Paenarthrobacter sp. DKR-5 TaxID=2835535 RepID=UPI001BDC917D|nr:hypothetical protein [Paenarthrobacter sp. DKR-5]MBT1001535.1 hypothetical protein [Paenarthrobacter sp. DKR-5]
MSWTDKVPPWLPPLPPPPRRGKGLMLAGLVILAVVFVFIIVMGLIGGTHTLYTLLALLAGLGLLIAGLLRRRR